MLRYYHVDIIDYYRGEVSTRRMWVLIKHLPPRSALVRALNDGRSGWTVTDDLLADVWRALIQTNSESPDSVPDHPIRELMQAKAREAEKVNRASELRSRFNRLKDRYTRKR